MDRPLLLELEDVLKFHLGIIEDGEPSDIRDEVGLRSAISQRMLRLVAHTCTKIYLKWQQRTYSMFPKTSHS